MTRIRAIALLFIIGILPVSQAATLVSAENASSLLMHPVRSSPALVMSMNQGNIPAQTSGVIEKLLAKVGDSYHQGETLAVLDCVDNTHKKNAEQAQLSQMETHLLFNKRELKRGKKLAKQSNIGEAELDRLSSAVDTAQSSLIAQQAIVSMALLNVERCNIKAPYHGVVTKRIASVGEMIEYGKPLVEMIETSTLEVSAKIANSDEKSFKEAESYLLEVNSELYPVSLRAILPIIQSNSRSREARFLFSNKKALAGSSGRLRWQSPMSYLPAHLLLKRDGQSGYFTVNESAGKSTAKFITVSSAEEGRPLLFNASTDVKIVTDGRHGLIDGEEIELTELSALEHGEKH